MTVAVLDNKDNCDVPAYCSRLLIEAQFRIGHACLPTRLVNFLLSKKRRILHTFSRYIRGKSISVVRQGGSHATQPTN